LVFVASPRRYSWYLLLLQDDTIGICCFSKTIQL
jgi:hypothetical protein